MFSEDTILLLYEITDVIIAGLSTGSVYALMAVGMTLVYGVTKAFNFAYGDFFNMGGYFAWILIFGLGFQFGGYLTVLIIVMPLMFAVGYGLEKLMVAPLRKRPDWENKVMMLTLGLALFLSSLYMVVFGVKMKSLPPIWEGTLEVGQLVFSYQDILIFVMSLGGILLFGWMLNNTRTGMAVKAVAQNPIGAKIVGIPQERIFAATFAISTGSVPVIPAAPIWGPTGETMTARWNPLSRFTRVADRTTRCRVLRGATRPRIPWVAGVPLDLSRWP